jgi:hypothetical protein
MPNYYLYSLLSQWSWLVAIIGVYILINVISYGYKFLRTQGATKAWHKKRLIHNAIAAVVVLLLLVPTLLGVFSSISGIGQGGSVPIPGTPTSGGYDYTHSYESGYKNAPLSDTREFIKKTFNATLKTRKVEDVARKTEILIKGSEGRIDDSNISTDFASFRFIIPKNNFDNFEKELRTYTNTKFYTQSISSINLLNEKRNIEQNQDSTQSNIEGLNKEKIRITTEYNKQHSAYTVKINSAQSLIDKYQNDLRAVNEEFDRSTSAEEQDRLRTQIYDLQDKVAAQFQILDVNTKARASLISKTKTQLENLGFSLEDQQSILKNLSEKTSDFYQNIETVDGYISIRHLSLWEAFTILSPVHPLILIFILLALLKIYYLHRKEKSLGLAS